MEVAQRRLCLLPSNELLNHQFLPTHKPATMIFRSRVSLCAFPTVSISETFRKLRKQGKVALIPYVTASDPDLSTTADVLKLLDSLGSDIIELEVPFPDPFLDGPGIQEACRRSLAKGTTLESILSMLKTINPEISCPIALFTYYGIILDRGTRDFISSLHDAGVRGLVVPDATLQDTEALREEALKNDIEVVCLMTPATPSKQMIVIVEAAQGFVYLVSCIGVTGARTSVNTRVESLLQEIKEVTGKPVAVGFGISKPEHAQQVAQWGADGVIVGSVIVKLLGEAKTPKQGMKILETFVKSLKSILP